MSTKKDVINELYNAALLTGGAAVIAFASRKLAKDSLGVPATITGMAKLALAFGLSSIGIKMMQDKGYLPELIDK